MESKTRTLFLKPSRSIGEMPKFDMIRLMLNKNHGIQTTLILDSNILIAMERIVRTGNKSSDLKKYGIHNLVEILRKGPGNTLYLSPAFAFDEMPPALAERARINFELFLSAHLPHFTDAPNCLQANYSGKTSDYGFLDLECKAQALMAISYAALLYLNLIDRHFPGSPIAKFREFLRRMANDVDILGTKEIEIAKYCFAEPKSDCPELIELRRKLRKNFLKTSTNNVPKNADEVFHIAFNGAADLHLINVANLGDTWGIDGIRQDAWIVTLDKKLAELLNIVHYANANGEAGKFAVIAPHEQTKNDFYWIEAEAEFMGLQMSRAKHHQQRAIDHSALINVAKSAMNEVKHAF